MSQHRRRFAWMILFASSLCTITAAQSTAPTTAPSVLKTDKLQEPPMQRAEWTPPKCDVPADVVAATTRLFQQGLADPRGCEYREMRVHTGDMYETDAGVVDCHGWIIPASDKNPQRFAVCWNGLVYRVASVGEIADLDADVNAVMKVKGDRWLGPDRLREAESVSEKTPQLIKVCLILRLGDGDLASRYWKWRTAAEKPSRQ